MFVLGSQETIELIRTITVSSAEELHSAVLSASGPTTILLEAGLYGDLYLNNLTNTDNITIKSADPDNVALFTEVSIINSQNVAFENVRIDYDVNDETIIINEVVNIASSSGIAIRNSVIKGGLATDGAPIDGGIEDKVASGNVVGLPTTIGVRVMNSQNIELSGNDMSEFWKGIVAEHINGFNVIDNEIHDVRTSPIAAGQMDNFTLEGNYIHTVTPWNFGGAGDHAGFLRTWVIGEEVSTNFIIRNNVFDRADGEAPMGIFLQGNGSLDNIKYKNVLIENNIVHNDHSSGILVESTDGLIIKNNSLINAIYDDYKSPTIGFKGEIYNAEVTGNVVSGEIVDRANAPGTAVFGENFVVQDFASRQENYVSDVYLDPLGDFTSLQKFFAAPDSVIAQHNLGSTMLRDAASPFAPDGFVEDITHEGRDSLQRDFVAHDLNGAIDFTNATVTWDFGDGSPTAVGLTASHVYSGAGDYRVTTTIQEAGGGQHVLQKDVVMVSSVIMREDFTANAEVDGGPVLAKEGMEFTDGVSLVPNGEGSAVQLNGGKVLIDTNEWFFDNKEFSIYLDFKPESTSDVGMIAYFSKTMFLQMRSADSLKFYVGTDAGAAFPVASGLGLSPDSWHRVGITFSGETSAFVIYLDGQEIIRETRAGGDSQVAPFSTDFILGGGFQGQVDNLLFLNYAADPEGAAFEKFAEASVTKATPVWSDLAFAQELEGDFVDWARLLEDWTALEPNYATLGTIEIGDDSIAAVSGNGGKNLVLGGAQGDEVRSGGEDDVLYGRNGDDVLNGQGGDDLVDGGAGNDILIGHDGNDVLVGGVGLDRFYGGQGDDIYVVDNTLEHISEGANAGTDKVLSSVEFTLEANVENMELTGTADILGRGNGLDNELIGNAGANILLGGSGNDTIFGGAGDDIIVSGAGNDIVSGGLGDDKINLKGGADIIVFNAGDSFERIYNFENGHDRIDLSSYGFTGMADIASAIFDTGGGADLHLGGTDLIRLAGIDAGLLDASDFIF